MAIETRAQDEKYRVVALNWATKERHVSGISYDINEVWKKYSEYSEACIQEGFPSTVLLQVSKIAADTARWTVLVRSLVYMDFADFAADE